MAGAAIVPRSSRAVRTISRGRILSRIDCSVEIRADLVQFRFADAPKPIDRLELRGDAAQIRRFPMLKTEEEYAHQEHGVRIHLQLRGDRHERIHRGPDLVR